MKIAVVTGALHHHLRCHQSFCSQLLPSHEPGAKESGHLVKLLPHWMVMNTWLNQQKKAKNNQNLE